LKCLKRRIRRIGGLQIIAVSSIKVGFAVHVFGVGHPVRVRVTHRPVVNPVDHVPALSGVVTGTLGGDTTRGVELVFQRVVLSCMSNPSRFGVFGLEILPGSFAPIAAEHPVVFGTKLQKNGRVCQVAGADVADRVPVLPEG